MALSSILNNCRENRRLSISGLPPACVPCNEEIPEFNKMAEVHKDKVQFISITFDSSEKVEKFLQCYPYHFRHLAVAGNFLKNDLQTNQYPKNIILDEKGTIVYVNSGMPFAPDKQTGEMKPVPYTHLSKHLDKILTSN